MIEKVSVITPIYDGAGFVPGIVGMVEVCAGKIENSVELVLVCDKPGEEMPEVSSDTISVVVLDADINRGVQGARIRGLENRSGGYVMFLDQDDYIRPDYLRSQLNGIGDNDAVVCRFLNGQKAHYTDTFRFEEVVSKKFLFTKWNSIISPGQVLIRREAISKLWKEHVLRNTGSDDYFLWLAMLADDKEFALNQEVLFERKLHQNNWSNDESRMLASDKEMLDILLNSETVSGDDKELLVGLYQSLLEITADRLSIFKQAYYCTNCLIRLERKGQVSAFFHNNNYKKVAVYGAGELGRQLYDFISIVSGLDMFFIDRNAECLGIEEPVYTLDAAPLDVDMIIVSLPRFEAEIKKDLAKKYVCLTVGIDELLALLGDVEAIG